MLRASVAAELAGIPTVSLVCEGFVRQARATGRGLGVDGMRLAVLSGHVDAQPTDVVLASLVERTLPEVVAGLTTPEPDGGPLEPEPAALDVVARGSLDDVLDAFHARGWTDGSPVVPPTRAAVEAFIAPGGHDPWRSLGTARPSGRDLTVWSVAVNGVMAGCEPRHLPVLLAVAEVLASDRYGVEHSGNTTGADALVVASGPSLAGLGFSHGPGAQREGVRANTAVGRWLRLFLRNVCGFTADEHDKATFGNAAKPVLCEDLDALREVGWPTLAGEHGGWGHDEDTVSVARINSTIIVGSVFGDRAEAVLPYLADGLVRATGWDLTHVFGLGQGQYSPLLVLSPLLARTIARSGWSKRDLQAALFEQARIPAVRFERYIGEWSNLTAGQRTLADLAAAGAVPAVYAASDDPQRLVPIVDDPTRFRIAVAGDPDRANALAMANDGPHGWWTTRPIDLRRSDDLACIVPVAGGPPGRCG